MSSNDLQEPESLERVYDAALEPQRFQELLALWNQKLTEADLHENLDGFEQHLNRAMQISELSLARWEADLNEDLYNIHQDTRPAAIFSHHGKVLDVNAAAVAAYNIGGGMSVLDLPFEPHMTRTIADQLRQAEGSSVLRTTRTDTQTAIAVYLFSAGAGRTVLRTTDLVWSTSLEDVLNQAFGLTPAELAITRLISEGHSVQDAADFRSTSVATVRAQIRAIYDKTHSESLNELVRMVIGLSGLPELSVTGNQGHPEAREQARPHPRDRHLFELNDGRMVEYVEFGPTDGVPVLYVHDNFYNVVWPDGLVRRFEEAGYRIVAPLRPLYGQSDAPAENIGSLQSCTDDLLEVAQALFDQPFLIFTRTLGLLYATMLARQRPDLVRHIVAFAPALPYASEDEVHGMPFAHRFQALATRRVPKMLEFMSRVVFAYLRQRGAVAFYRWAYREVPADLEVLELPIAKRCIEAASEIATVHGARAWLNDMQRISAEAHRHRWQCPVHTTVYIGEADKNTRWARAIRLIESGAKVTAMPVQGAGELFFYTHHQLAVDAINRAHRES